MKNTTTRADLLLLAYLERNEAFDQYSTSDSTSDSTSESTSDLIKDFINRHIVEEIETITLLQKSAQQGPKNNVLVKEDHGGMGI